MTTIDAAIIKHITSSGGGGEDKFVHHTYQQVTNSDANGNYTIKTDSLAIHPSTILRVFNKETQETEDYFTAIFGKLDTSSKPSSENGIFVPFNLLDNTGSFINFLNTSGCFRFYFWQSSFSGFTLEFKANSNSEIDISKGHGLLYAEEFSPSSIAKINRLQVIVLNTILQKINNS